MAWAGNPGIYTIRKKELELRTTSKGNLQTISMPSRANRSSSHLHTNRGRTNRDNAGLKCNDLVYHLSQAELIHRKRNTHMGNGKFKRRRMVYMPGFPAHINTVGQRMYSRFSLELLGTFLILHAVQVLVRHMPS
jgi:hypothetical protein